MDTNQIAWIAGILEGEGSFIIRHDQNFIVITCSMTDEDIIDRLALFSGIGNKNIKQASQPHHKIQYKWSVSKRRDIEEFLPLILPYMGKRRSNKIIEVMQWLQDHPRQRQENGQVKHGTVSKYSYGCRCDLCRRGESEYRKNIKRLRKQNMVSQSLS